MLSLIYGRGKLQKFNQLQIGSIRKTAYPYTPSYSSVLKALEGIDGKEGIEAITNYLIDLIKRGGYNENLLKKRLAYKKLQ